MGHKSKTPKILFINLKVFIMTSNDFFCYALLSIAANSNLNEIVNYKEWAESVERKAAILTEIAEENNCFDEPGKPP